MSDMDFFECENILREIAMCFEEKWLKKKKQSWDTFCGAVGWSLAISIAASASYGLSGTKSTGTTSNNIKISRKKSPHGPTRITQKLGIPAPKTECFLNVHGPGYVFFVFPP